MQRPGFTKVMRAAIDKEKLAAPAANFSMDVAITPENQAKAQQLIDKANAGNPLEQQETIWLKRYQAAIRSALSDRENALDEQHPDAPPRAAAPQAVRYAAPPPPREQPREQARQLPQQQEARQMPQPPMREQPREQARPAQKPARRQAEMSAEASALIAIASLTVVLLIGLRILVLDATMSTIGFAAMKWIPQDWNTNTIPILWGLLGNWSNWLLTQGVVVVIQSTLMPIVWAGFYSKKGRFQFPIRIENPLDSFNVSPWLICFVWGGAIVLNIGTTFKGLYTQIPLWEPIEVFSSIPWPKSGGELTVTALFLSCVVSLGGESIVRSSASGILSAITDLRNSRED